MSFVEYSVPNIGLVVTAGTGTLLLRAYSAYLIALRV
jgi:hypothetical protein